MKIQLRTIDAEIKTLEIETVQEFIKFHSNKDTNKISIDFLGARLALYGDGTFMIFHPKGIYPLIQPL